MVPIDTTIITIPMIAVTAKITIAQMIPVFDAFWGTAAPGLCGYAMAPRSHVAEPDARTFATARVDRRRAVPDRLPGDG